MGHLSGECPTVDKKIKTVQLKTTGSYWNKRVGLKSEFLRVKKSHESIIQGG